MENKTENFKNGEHKLIWQKIENLEKYLINDIKSELKKINGRQWKLIFIMLTVLCGFCGALILALLKILS
ncbi:hypothetical protein ES702_03079 [subsurface metagenome]